MNPYHGVTRIELETQQSLEREKNPAEMKHRRLEVASDA